MENSSFGQAGKQQQKQQQHEQKKNENKIVCIL
jgi:hypothetical protein